VRYGAVNAMLLNEFLKEHRKVERANTVGRVGFAFCVELERAPPCARVEYAGGVAQERAVTDARVEAAGGVAKERRSPRRTGFSGRRNRRSSVFEYLIYEGVP
jgi:hypothetical protein